MNRKENIKMELDKFKSAIDSLAVTEYERGVKDGVQRNVNWHKWSEKKPYSDTTVIMTVEYDEDWRDSHEMWNVKEYSRVVVGYVHNNEVFIDGKPMSGDLRVVAWVELPNKYLDD